MIELPPPDVAPEVLFRLLLKTPRPELPVAIPLRGAGGAFSVRAITGLELFSARDDSKAAPGPLRRSRLAQQLISLCLYQGGSPVFGSPDQVGRLDEDDYTALSNAVLPAVSTISPAYGLSDSGAWESRLFAGANHPTNLRRAEMLGGCCERRTVIGVCGKQTTCTTVTTDRPDRFFGLPFAQLTDGHVLCYRAARRLMRDR